MPLPFYHIAIAGVMAARYPHAATGDFFLGNIAPDAVLSHPDCTEKEKFRTHLRGERALWRGDVMKSFADSDKSDFFMLGYHMHLMTDIFFRDRWERAYASAGIPEEKWDKTAYRAASYGIKVLCDGEITAEQYAAWISLAKSYSVRTFPFELTSADMDAEITFSANLSPYLAIDMETETERRQAAQIADFADIYHQAIPYLVGIFGEYLTTPA